MFEGTVPEEELDRLVGRQHDPNAEGSDADQVDDSRHQVGTRTSQAACLTRSRNCRGCKKEQEYNHDDYHSVV